MSQMAFIGSPSLALQGKASHRPLPQPPAGTWRFIRREENITGLSWVVAIAISFLTIGVIGIFQKEAPFEITLAGRAGLGASDADSTDLTMAELHAMEEAPEIVAVETEIVPQVDLVEPVEVFQDLPELAEALITEDVFTVPAAPRIKDALRPVDPAPPKPKVQPAPARPRSSRPTTVASGAQGGTQGNGGGGGGSSATGAGSGGGRMPRPSYPSSARSRGISGSMTLALSVTPAGVVESASVVSCQGAFTSGEQATVASFVRRNWRFPSGAYRKHTVPIVFKLQR